MVVLLVTLHLLSDGVGLLASRLRDPCTPTPRVWRSASWRRRSRSFPWRRRTSAFAVNLLLDTRAARLRGAVTGLHPCLFEPR